MPRSIVPDNAENIEAKGCGEKRYWKADKDWMKWMGPNMRATSHEQV
jgi:hypothetical protein